VESPWLRGFESVVEVNLFKVSVIGSNNNNINRCNYYSRCRNNNFNSSRDINSDDAYNYIDDAGF